MDYSILFFISIVLTIGLILFAVVTKQFTSVKLNKEDYQVEWLRISNSINLADRNTFDMAVINADKLLSKAMTELGIRGQGVGQQLKNGSKRFSNLNGIWAAHKLRNKIAHEHNFELSSSQVRSALNQFKQALKDLGAI